MHILHVVFHFILPIKRTIFLTGAFHDRTRICLSKVMLLHMSFKLVFTPQLMLLTTFQKIAKVDFIHDGFTSITISGIQTVL